MFEDKDTDPRQPFGQREIFASITRILAPLLAWPVGAIVAEFITL